MDNNETICERPNTRFPIVAVVISALITVFLGLIGITYSNVEKQIDLKANKEAVILMEQNIENQLKMQNSLLNDLKLGQQRIEMTQKME